MSSEIMAQLEQLRELPEYLKHENIEVRKQALQIITAFVDHEEAITFFNENGIIKILVRMINDENEIATLSLALLVNISAFEHIRDVLVDCGVVNICMDFLLSAKNIRASRNALSILNNVTLNSQGAIEAMQEGKEYEGLHLLRLMKWFTNRELSKGSDDWVLAGNIICNLSQLESCRRILVDPKRNLLVEFMDLIRGTNEERTIISLRIIHNIVFDMDKHFALLNPDARLWASVMYPIIAYNTEDGIDEEDMSKIIPSIQFYLNNPSKTYSTNAEIRRLVLDIIFVMCRNDAARLYLRVTNHYHIVRELHKYERELENDATDIFIDDDVIPFFILDEEAKRDKEENAMEIALYRLERQSLGLENDDEEEEEETQDSVPMALVEPDEAGEILDAQVYNDRMAAKHAAEEKAMEDRAKKINKPMYEPKEGAFDPLAF